GGLDQVVRPLAEKELAALVAHLSGARAISPASQKQVRVIFGTESLTSGVTGTDSAYLDARDWKLVSGRPFSDSETRSGTGVCLIGETVRQQFFGAGDPEGEIIRVNRTSCKIIGLLEPKGYTGFGQDQDNVVLMPLHAYQRRIAGNRDIDNIYIAADDRTPTSELQLRVEDILRDARRITPDRESDFAIRDMTQIADAMASATTTMTGMLGAVAGVSLLVGGIGIMNIMLVSVTERTREIGIRLAIGAHEKHILIQFLVEATVLSLLGGIIGILIGLALAGLAAVTLTIRRQARSDRRAKARIGQPGRKCGQRSNRFCTVFGVSTLPATVAAPFAMLGQFTWVEECGMSKKARLVLAMVVIEAGLAGIWWYLARFGMANPDRVTADFQAVVG
ncbi:ABC transporter permease, partial [Mesorhizobium sp.]|uniref:ABC transporter permease n=1 Tax=Mesorhizobium sp. TaxID=1871066 RepID=UPI0025BE6B3A